MRVNNLFESVLFESMVVYHGSDERFDKFDPERVKSASGADKGGWGFYFTDSEEVASQYISGRGAVDSYRIPSGPYFDLNDGLEYGVGLNILDELEEREISDSDLEQFREEFLSDDYIFDTSNEQVYDWLGHVLGSRRAASEFIGYLGYVGNVYSDKTDPDVKNYVVFDSNDIKKIS